MSTVRLEKKNQVGIITIDSPPVNALNKEVFNSLEEAILQVDETISVIVIHGAGTKAFVAGADIKEFPELTPEEGEKLCLRGQSVFNRLSDLGQPVIAAIDGFALGGGLELALACDIRLATSNSTFGLPEVKLGIIPGYGATQRLPRLIGRGKAMKMIFSGEFLSADEALRCGLIEEVVEGDVMDKAMELAAVIASRGPIAVQKAKEAVTKGMEMPLAEGQKLEAKLFADICMTQDKNEGVTAFFEKRRPEFIGK
ncbi:enoyl-CoA hydratase/carnithine racemase [Bacillus ectoiniformans]|uniref:enoyl-CoA hydratase/isomerase family protein n=1 Tax=Bacillus ectoiniformans TaxID=1494429 RepID=UPI001958C495|nr:enoyl-CoA hydratase-related protein [Bacillus ectoiniformans]MBM7649667.1 enoyl-CoA hydratase/carnithine racemase [Bacillus ectoiniformans]